MSGYAAGIVLFNPNIDRLRLNINSIYTQVNKVYLYDNGSKNLEEIDSVMMLFADKNVQLVRSKENLGIAAALQKLAEKAYDEGYCWLLTLDQDSVSPANMMQKFLRYENEPNVGMICPVMYDSRRKNERKPLPVNKSKDVDFCITSGALTRICVWKNIGGFDEWLFIGLVDNEYCYRLIKAGYRIIQDQSVILDHELGSLNPSKFEKLYLRLGEFLKCESIKKMSYKRTVSPIRLYYGTRNMIYLNWKYPKNSVKEWSSKALIKNIVLSIMRGKNKVVLVKAVYNGIKDANIKIKGQDACS